MLVACKRVWATQSLPGFARGLGPTLCREIPGNGLFFASYELFQRTAADSGLADSSFAPPVCGGLAGMAYWAFVLPVDTAKTRIQCLSPGQPLSELGLLGTLRSEFRAKGLGGWYAGARPMMVRAFVANAAQWAAWDWARGVIA